MTKEEFIVGFAPAGFKLVESRKDNFVIFTFLIPVGKFAGQEIRLALNITGDMPLIAPGGPHISPRLLPLHPGHDLPHPLGAVHASDTLGPEWQYWSRPFPDWNAGERTARRYVQHLIRLFDTQ